MNDPATTVRDAEWERQHLYALYYGEMGLCGCGTPEDAYDLIRDLLNLCPLFEDNGWMRAAELIGSSGAVHIVLGALDRAGLIEHGGGIGGSWLTPKGEYVRAVMRRHEFDPVDGENADGGVCGAYLPHDGDPCEPGCWIAPPEPPAQESVSPLDRLPRHRSPYIGCHSVAGTWIHGQPHDCPRFARGR